ncbi:MAG TPA: BadF/BadG/BcrA/BcrD ATPase family protein [Bryobacteraceae bacterium]|nr:BadF/BadG/BcrA/BcrD ATPase family protein [Bryobacteraceae bacterium]
MPRYYLGVDGGQSSTTALIADDHGRIVGVGRAGPCNHISGDEARAKFKAVLGDCLEQAGQDLAADSRTQGFAAACLGFSGGPEDKQAYSRELIRAARLKVVNDAEIALTGATGGQPGIIVIAGTGSISFGRNAAGKVSRAGGWGYIFGDEGSAFDIARRALRAALQWEEGWGPITSLHASLLEATHSKSANQLLHRFYTDKERKSVAALAPLVTAAAESGDTVAQRILVEAARVLAQYASGVHRALFATGEPVIVAHVGGVFQSDRLRNTFAEVIAADLRCQTSYPKFSPAAGAVLEALRLDHNAAQLSAVPHTKT